MQSRKECYICRMLYGDVDLSSYGLEEHHCINGNPGRKKSERYGLKVWLCPDHHRNGRDSVHKNAKLMQSMKQVAQEEFEKTHTREEWMQEFGKNYLEVIEL